MRRDDAFLWDAGPAAALGVATQAAAKLGRKVISGDAEMSLAGHTQIRRSLGAGGVGVVKHETLTAGETGPNERVQPSARAHHVETKPEVGVEEPLAVKGRLSRSLDADQHHHLHGRKPRVRSQVQS